MKRAAVILTVLLLVAGAGLRFGVPAVVEGKIAAFSRKSTEYDVSVEKVGFELIGMNLVLNGLSVRENLGASLEGGSAFIDTVRITEADLFHGSRPNHLRLRFSGAYMRGVNDAGGALTDIAHEYAQVNADSLPLHGSMVFTQKGEHAEIRLKLSNEVMADIRADVLLSTKGAHPLDAGPDTLSLTALDAAVEGRGFLSGLVRRFVRSTGNEETVAVLLAEQLNSGVVLGRPFADESDFRKELTGDITRFITEPRRIQMGFAPKAPLSRAALRSMGENDSLKTLDALVAASGFYLKLNK
ncbi:MAG: hypothetical protein ACQEQV_02085 [Fibrobacterota bacterium]